MSSPNFAITPSLFDASPIASFIAANALTAKILVDQYLSSAATGNLPPFFGGCSIIDLKASSTDSVAKDILLYVGTLLTTVGANTGTATTTTSTVTRASGSFLTDGWQIGDQIMVFGAKGSANATDGIQAIVTGVAATTLTVNGTPFSAGTLNSATRLFRIGQDLRAAIPANAGTQSSSASNPSIGLLNNVNDGSILRYEQKLGVNEVLIAAMQTAVSALPAYVNVVAQVARY